MKTMAVAALAAVLAVAPAAVARAGSDEPSPEPVARPSSDVQALVWTMTSNSRVAREVLELARSRRHPNEVRCSDEALSRADVALRRGLEDVQEMTLALSTHDAKWAATAMHRLEARVTASRDAAAIARGCIPRESGARGPDRTQVIVHVVRTGDASSTERVSP
jgi:hypothetical protein